MVNIINLKKKWARFWMRYSGLSPVGRIATRFASMYTPPFYGRHDLARYNPKGYISPSAQIQHSLLTLGRNVFIDDRVLIYEDKNGGPVELGNKVRIYRDTIVQTGAGGSLSIDAGTAIQPRCQLSAYKGSIRIGSGVQIAPNCAFYPYDHGVAADELISEQALRTKGGITIGDDAWLGVGVIVLDGVKIGRGAVIGAGAVVTKEIPDGAIATGVPAHVVGMRK